MGQSSSGRRSEHPRDVIARALARIYGAGLTTASGGNLSLRDADDEVWITPARLDKGTLRAADVVRVAQDGESGGPNEASSELPFHRALYAARPDVGAIVHAHPAALGAWAICHRVPDLSLLPRARAICGDLGSIPYALSGTNGLADGVAEAFARGLGCALLENHGVIAVGGDMDEALQRLEALDGAARILARANESRSIVRDVDELAWRDDRSSKDASTHAETGAILCQFVRRAYERRLLCGQSFCMSTRVQGDAFLANQSTMDAAAPETIDIAHVSVADEKAERVAGTDHLLHRAIYAIHSNVHAVITAAPVHATALGLAGRPVDPRVLSESLAVLRAVRCVPAASVVDDPSCVAAAVGEAAPAALLGGLGVLVHGGSLLEAFDRLEVLESTAAAIIESRQVGEAIVLSDEAIAELQALMESMRAS